MSVKCVILFTHAICKYGRATDKIAVCGFHDFYLVASEEEVISWHYIWLASNLKLIFKYGIAQELTPFQQVLSFVWKGPHGIEAFESHQNIIDDIFIHYDDDTTGSVYAALHSAH